MKDKNTPQSVGYDERQQQIVLKSYSISYWFVMFILYFATFGKPNLLLNIAFFGSLTFHFCYSTLKGASPFVDPRFGKFAQFGRFIGIPLIILGIMDFILTIVMAYFRHDGFTDFITKSSYLWLSALWITCMGASLLYRNYINKKEADE